MSQPAFPSRFAPSPADPAAAAGPTQAVGPGRIGDFTAVRRVGSGATAEVWAGVADDGRDVALKLYRLPRDQAMALARREAALAAEVDHPHLVEILGITGADDDPIALVTALAVGGSLAGVLERRGSLTPGETITVLVPVASALATAHERGVVHGDISPANILFDRAGRPALADLGAARAAVDLGAPVSATPTHVAPEVARGAVPSAAADLFALGAVALHCLSGRPAWNADDLRDVVIQSTIGQWPDLDVDAPVALLSVVRALLDADPTRRPGAATVVIDLRTAGPPEPVDLAPELARTQSYPATRARDPLPLSPGPPGRGRGRGRARRAGHRRRRVDPSPSPLRRSILLGACVLVLLTGAVAGGLWWAGAGHRPAGAPTAAGSPATAAGQAGSGGPTRTAGSPGPTRTAGPAADRWFQEFQTLDRRRASALATRDVSVLQQVYSAGSAAAEADRRTIQRLRADGLVVTGAAHVVQSVRTVSEPAPTGPVRLEVVDRLPAYDIADATGRVIGRTVERGEQHRIVVLVDGADGYRIALVSTA